MRRHESTQLPNEARSSPADEAKAYSKVEWARNFARVDIGVPGGIYRLLEVD